MNKYKFRQYLLNVHKDRRDYTITPKTVELEITESFKIVIPRRSSRVLKCAARDFCDYLLVSMGVGVCVVYRDTIDLNEDNAIIICTKENVEICLNDAESYKGYMAMVDKNIVLCGFDERGAAQAVYYLEDVMNLRMAPFLEKETVYKKPLFSPRMTHSGYGLDNFPDAHLSEIAHAGMDAIIVFARSYYESASAYMDLNEIIYRAEGYGLDVYAYSYIKSLFHPDDERAFGYYDGNYGELFRQCPKLKGVILVGESIGFHSKDKRSNGLLPGENANNLLHGDKPSPGSFPCYDYPEWLELLKKVIKKENPNADIVFWTYNFNGTPLEDRIKLIQNMPKDISLLSTFEKPELIPFGDSLIPCTDYTLAFEGPGENFLSEAQAAKDSGVRLYTMSNTGGLTWDIGTVPYLPCPMQWKKRYDKLKECRDKYGLSGLMESHHYGFYPSFVGELAKWEFSSDSPDYMELMEKIATRDFDKEHEEKVLLAWERLSEAIRCCPPSVEDQYGALRIGPAYPLSFNIHNGIKTVPYAMFGGEKICHTMYACYDADSLRFPGRTPFPVRIVDDITILEKAVSLTDEAGNILEKIAKTNNACYMANLVKYMANTFRTVLHVKKWYILKLQLLSCCDSEKVRELARNMRELANEEIENAKNTLPLVDFDSRLGWEPSMDYIGDREHIEIKIKQMEIMLKNEISDYELA